MVDTGAWYALADASDSRHEAAKTFYAGCAEANILVTTNLILAETWTLLSARLGRHTALTFWSALRQLGIEIWTVEAIDMEAAWRILQAFPDQTFSLVDCTTFSVMERRKTLDAFAFDSHFLVYRFGPHCREFFRRHP